MAVGSVGDYLQDKKQCDLFVSYDGGITWEKSRSKPHMYEIGDNGALLVALEDVEHDATDTIW